MLRQMLTLCVLILMFSFIGVHAHNVPNPGPSIIEGDLANMSEFNMILWDFVMKSWSLHDTENDSLGNPMLKSLVHLEKRLHFHPNGRYWGTSGTSTAVVAASEKVSGFETRGEYYIKAKARGRLWYRSSKESKKYSNGVYRSVDKDAARYSGQPTYSGVHMWGKAEVSNQFASTLVVFEWL